VTEIAIQYQTVRAKVIAESMLIAVRAGLSWHEPVEVFRNFAAALKLTLHDISSPPGDQVDTRLVLEQ